MVSVPSASPAVQPTLEPLPLAELTASRSVQPAPSSVGPLTVITAAGDWAGSARQKAVTLSPRIRPSPARGNTAINPTRFRRAAPATTGRFNTGRACTCRRSRRGAVTGRRVLITGAARGIGAATARRLADEGAKVALAGIEPELLERVAAECGGAPWWDCDVSDRARVQEVVDAAAEAFGGLDAVVANAGVAAQMAIV